MDHSTYVLITGASGGIGYELAKIFAVHKHNLILVARSEKKLLQIKEELEKKHDVSIVVMPKDLSANNSVTELFSEIKHHGMEVHILVNNAGFGDYGHFLDADLMKLQNMIELNIRALMQMTYLFAGEMRKKGYGKILNVASVAGFTAMPYFAVYAATKAFVLSFSQAIDEELEGTGISVVALCPGPVSTGFERAANMTYSKTMMLGAYSPLQIAKSGYRALMKGKSVQYGGWTVGMVNIVSRLLPRKWMRKIVKKVLQHE
ncbi:MAG: SDR family oxidoreductase [Bacteroidales bacterium]|jgi:short-subunit dehydrogenase|nr:SDR family oxidoreductase [Bacteroidales bacterium]